MKYCVICFDFNMFEVDVVDFQEVDLIKWNLNVGEFLVKYGIVYFIMVECCDCIYFGVGKVDLRGMGFVVDDMFDFVGNCLMGGVFFILQGVVVDFIVIGFFGMIILYRGVFNLSIDCGNGL